MEKTIKLEELAQFLFSIYLFSLLPFAWWVYPVFLFAPDLSMVGYLAGPRVGAIIYNLIHHKAISLALIVLGFLLALPVVSLAGVILFGHTSLDRVLGYGLKYPDSFRHTHLGMIGQEKQG
jgi:ABC-type nitrate/sulfonate/bicarbonate transport system permease component